MKTAEKEPKTQLTIESQVLAELGKPKDLHRIDTRQVGKDTYRVNIWRTVPTDGKTIFKTKEQMTDSFYVWSNSANEILRTNPRIEKKYGQPA